MTCVSTQCKRTAMLTAGLALVFSDFNLFAASIQQDMVVIGGGEYKPLFNNPTLPSQIKVESYNLDRYLVSNGKFSSFITAHRQWRKSEVKSLFADERYLHHFPNEIKLENTLYEKSSSSTLDFTNSSESWLNQPVTNVSWFSASAYCASQGKRLPTVYEWEYAARASKTEIDATNSVEHRSRILEWYGTLTGNGLPPVAETPVNVWGVYGMHGVVWEMVDDFNSVLVTGESRGDTQLERSLFCGAGAASSTNPSDYAAFMRYALRSSYEANYTLETLGFRCAGDLN